MNISGRVDPICGSIAGRKTNVNQSKKRGTGNDTIGSGREVKTNTYIHVQVHSYCIRECMFKSYDAR